MLQVIREEGETIDHLLRRYNDRVKRINFVAQVKLRAFHRRPISRRTQKTSILYKIGKRSKIEYLKRIGKFEERGYGQGNYRSSRSTSNTEKTSSTA